MAFIAKESFLHKLAKEQLFKWLEEEENKGNDCCKFAQFSWRQKYGVFMELPFHETDDVYYFECSAFASFDHNNNFVPLDIDRGKILFVPDIVVFHKGTPIYIFEIVASNPLTDRKIQAIKTFFGDYYHIEVYEVSAMDIMKMLKKPDFLPCKQII